jgi:hypothetical protein
MDNGSQWWAADEHEVAGRVFAYVSEVDRSQWYLFDRFVKLAALYDPYDTSNGHGYLPSSPWSGPDGIVSENLIASNVDTVYAELAATDVRARFMTDGADWEQQRTAREMGYYAEGVCKQLDVDIKHKLGFKDGSLKGTGLVKVYVDWVAKRPRVEWVLVDDIVVDEGEVRGGEPLQMHERIFVDREVLRGKYPDREVEISQAQTGEGWRDWAGYHPIERDELVVIESWRLPVGVRGTEYYKPGLHTVCIDGLALVHEEYHEDFFPFAVFRWSMRPRGWYGIGLGERISPHQRRKNKLAWQIDAGIDRWASPTTYVGMADANLAVKTTNRIGTVAVVKGGPPVTVMPPAVSPEVYARDEALTEKGFEETGLSRMAATSRRPPGVNSGVALREYRDQRSQRFSQQEKGFEQFKLDIVWLLMWCCKELGDDAPVVTRRTRFGTKKIRWADVDMGEVKVQLQAASNLARTPAGRTQLVMDWAQAGIISVDEVRRLIGHPDIEKTWSTYTAALENIERMLDEVLDGATDVVPEPMHNLKLAAWRFQQEYNLVQMNGAPEEVLDALHAFITQAEWMLELLEAPPPMAMPPGEMVGPDTGGPALPPGPMPAGPPQGPPPQSALAPEAMNLIAR